MPRQPRTNRIKSRDHALEVLGISENHKPEDLRRAFAKIAYETNATQIFRGESEAARLERLEPFYLSTEAKEFLENLKRGQEKSESGTKTTRGEKDDAKQTHHERGEPGSKITPRTGAGGFQHTYDKRLTLRDAPELIAGTLPGTALAKPTRTDHLVDLFLDGIHDLESERRNYVLGRLKQKEKILFAPMAHSTYELRDYPNPLGGSGWEAKLHPSKGSTRREEPWLTDDETNIITAIKDHQEGKLAYPYFKNRTNNVFSSDAQAMFQLLKKHKSGETVGDKEGLDALHGAVRKFLDIYPGKLDQINKNLNDAVKAHGHDKVAELVLSVPLHQLENSELISKFMKSKSKPPQ